MWWNEEGLLSRKWSWKETGHRKDCPRRHSHCCHTVPRLLPHTSLCTRDTAEGVKPSVKTGLLLCTENFDGREFADPRPCRRETDSFRGNDRRDFLWRGFNWCLALCPSWLHGPPFHRHRGQNPFSFTQLLLVTGADQTHACWFCPAHLSLASHHRRSSWDGVLRSHYIFRILIFSQVGKWVNAPEDRWSVRENQAAHGVLCLLLQFFTKIPEGGLIL